MVIKKILLKEELFGKKFKIKIKNDFQKINFNLLSSGLSAEINFSKKTKPGSTIWDLLSQKYSIQI